MAVSNGYWSTGTTTVPNIPQIRPPLSSSSFDFTVAKKSFNLKFVSNSSNVMKSSLPPVNNSCRCSNIFDHATSSDWDWNQWTRHFSEVELAERSVSLLQFQLEEAIEKEDFQEASKLKTAIEEATSKDSVTEIMSELKNAIHEERYQDASKLCKNTGSGLVGWWVGYSKDSDDPFGRLIRITPGVGRFIGKSYNPRQLVSASPGTPLFEIFVVKENDETYTMQVVFMQRAKLSNVKNTPPTNSSLTKGAPITDIKNAPVIDVKVNEDQPNKNDEKSIKFEGATEDGIRSVLNYIKDIIPNLKVKEYSVMEVDVEEVMKDNDTVNQLMQEDDEKTTSDEDSEDENTDLDDTQPERIVVGPNSDETDDVKDLEIKLFVGGVLHSRDDTPSKYEFVRVPAEIEEMEKDSFVLHVPVKVHDLGREESITSKVKIAAIASQGVSELMPPDVAKALWSSDKVSRKVSRDVREIVKFAVNQAKKQEKLSEYTNFSRITATRGDLDPFDGLYVGAFGPYGTEVVQLKRKYGNWSANDVEFFEYVEAVKVTGDLNVPAGQVAFRAKIAKASHFSNRGMYPDELGVVGSYKGQGRIAEFGYKNPKWVEGELLQLNGKGMRPYVKGADLGFLYVVPEQSFLVLFNRLRLPE